VVRLVWFSEGLDFVEFYEVVNIDQVLHFNINYFSIFVIFADHKLYNIMTQFRIIVSFHWVFGKIFCFVLVVKTFP